MSKEFVSVRFITGHAPYQAGEIAGFPPNVAERIFAAGAGVPVDSSKRKMPKKGPVPAVNTSVSSDDATTKKAAPKARAVTKKSS